MSNAIRNAILVCAVALAVAPIGQALNGPDDYLIPHNRARAEVGVGPLVWDNKVAAYALNYANQRKGDCKLVHSHGSYGENIFWGSAAMFNAADAVKAWVAEKAYYDCSSNSCTHGKVCGHYTQVVWQKSVKVGCARVVCDTGGVFIICNYSPPGNYVGQRPYPCAN